ncbi:hypothetical protein J6590_013304 [Homalodisca vitripennis]|nr:hypothetical protein J6590_013304 [Homalodisca vitripennis]
MAVNNTESPPLSVYVPMKSDRARGIGDIWGKPNPQWADRSSYGPDRIGPPGVDCERGSTVVLINIVQKMRAFRGQLPITVLIVAPTGDVLWGLLALASYKVCASKPSTSIPENGSFLIPRRESPLSSRAFQKVSSPIACPTRYYRPLIILGHRMRTGI